MLGMSKIALQPIGKPHYNAVYKFGMLWISIYITLLHYSTVHISYFNNRTSIYSGICINIILYYNRNKCNCLFSIRTKFVVIAFMYNKVKV